MTGTSRMTETGAAEPRPDARRGRGRAAARRPAERPRHRSRRAGAQPGLGVVGWLRWGWRQLTSMRTALILLFLLAVASVPGSLLPQQGIDPAAVQQYYVSHPGAGPVAGPAVPVQRVRGALVRRHLPAAVPVAGRLRGAPGAPAGPLGPGAAAARAAQPGPAAAVGAAPDRRSTPRPRSSRGGRGAAARAVPAAHRRRLGVGGKGLPARSSATCCSTWRCSACWCRSALGGLFGYKANRLLVAGTSFANTVTALDEFHPGRLVSPADLQPFTITLNRFSGQLRHVRPAARPAVLVQRAT